MTVPRHRPPLALLALLVVLPACDTGPDVPGEVDWDELPVREGTVDLTIGEMDGRPEEELGSVGGVARDGDGRIYVADAQADEVRVFSPDGGFLFAFGRGGEGPGELAGPCCLAFGPDGLLWVRETGGNHRYSAFRVASDSAAFVRTLPMQHTAMGLWAPTTFDTEGRLVDIGFRVDTVSRDPVPVRMHLDRESGEVMGRGRLPRPPGERVGMHEITRESGEGVSTFYLQQPFGPRHLVAHGPGGEWAEALSDLYGIRWYQFTGSSRIVVGSEDRGPELTAGERAEAEERLAGYRERHGLAEGDLPWGVPARRPPLEGLFFDAAGRLWVHLSARTPEGRNQAHVFDRDGNPVARYTWPDGVTLDGIRAWIGEDVALGIAADSLDVPRVARIRFGG